MEIYEEARLAEALPGVRRTEREGLAEWRYHGRLVARQLDAVRKTWRTTCSPAVRQAPGDQGATDRYCPLDLRRMHVEAGG